MPKETMQLEYERLMAAEQWKPQFRPVRIPGLFDGKAGLVLSLIWGAVAVSIGLLVVKLLQLHSS